MNRKLKNNVIIAILATTMASGAALIPVLSSISNAFPAYAHLVHLLVTIPPLMVMVSSMSVNPLLKVLTGKNITILGLCLILFSGVYPYFSSSFILLLISRVIMGLGLGLITTISSSLPARYFPAGQDRDIATGLQSAFSSLGSVLFSLLSGCIANYFWKGVFLVQLLNMVPLIIIMLYMRPNFSDDLDLELSLEGESNIRPVFIKSAFPITFLAFVYITISATFPLNLSMFVELNEIGTTSLTGFVAGLNALLGFIIGILFYTISRSLREFTLPASLFMVSLSFLIVSSATSPFMFIVGSSLFGVGTSLVYPAFLTAIYSQVPDIDVIPAISMYTIAANIAQFLSPFIINNAARWVGPNIEHRFLLAALATTVLGAFIMLANRRRMRQS